VTGKLAYNTMKTPIGQGDLAVENIPTKHEGRTKFKATRAVLAVLLVILLNGCASLTGSGDPDPWHYNPNTGYPAVGGPSWGRF